MKSKLIKNQEEKISMAFGIDFAECYCKVFVPHQSTKTNIKRIKRLKPQAYKELLSFLEPFADRILEREKGVKTE